MNDPCRVCDLYKEEGCVHVDGYLCKVETCEMLSDYLKNKQFRKELREMMQEQRKIASPVPYA